MLFGWGAWQRRWIADDGLIVLRTVRNLLAGNGPVFNMGERVEANTSTVWTYLLYVASWVGGPMRLEYVALAVALMLSLLGRRCSCWVPGGCMRPACAAAGRSCCRPARWSTSRCRRRETSQRQGWKADWC
ncbi:arabinosyltransferase AftB domain protein [Mycobacterium kansasii]|uniref:Arabinosyltransferase AftB domain protein n=1 Tax=Mycobacterium kansasii TaxID=1768 RepID=A0A1V3WWW5_MYCKA|nr:arabinosyltransferase AftB domain protein [Mycobacterium kansasii]